MSRLTKDEHIKKLEAKLKKLKIEKEETQKRKEEMWRQWQEAGCDY